ncbi:MAG: tryptophan halogenase [Betaproteobacteria bacterium]|nr:tryptophan halogenase [Betaproteobacteria bacterium]
MHQLKGDDASWANALLRLVAGLPLYGVEKSFKLGPAELLRDRFLLGLKPDAYARLDLDALRTALAMPERSFASMAADLKRANFLGLAYESGAKQRVFKAYVEFPVPARRQPGPTPGSVAAHMIYHGYKWDPDRGEDAALTQYWWAPQLTLAEIGACIARHQADIKRAEVRATVQQIIARCARDCDARQFQYIEAREGMGSRVSYDLNVYPAALPLAEIAGPLKNAALALAVDPLALEALLAQSAGRTLGHVSAGTDRHGQDFLTIYHEQ